jgi:hypothetical protein
MYAALEVHTSKMIAAGCQAVREFTQLLDVSHSLCHRSSFTYGLDCIAI